MAGRSADLPTPRRPWLRRYRAAVLGVAVLLVIVVGAVTVPLARQRLRYGVQFGPSQTMVRVSAGDRFSLVVAERTAVGFRWRVERQPDQAVARSVRQEYAPSLAGRVWKADGCCDGTRYFTFRATGTGRTEIVLFNCFQGCASPDKLAYSSSQRWSVEVR